jgi:hypothetical protein
MSINNEKVPLISRFDRILIHPHEQLYDLTPIQFRRIMSTLFQEHSSKEEEIKMKDFEIKYCNLRQARITIYDGRQLPKYYF